MQAGGGWVSVGSVEADSDGDLGRYEGKGQWVFKKYEGRGDEEEDGAGEAPEK